MNQELTENSVFRLRLDLAGLSSMALWLASILGLVILAHGPSQTRHVLSVQPIESDRGETFPIYGFCSEREPTNVGRLVLDGEQI